VSQEGLVVEGPVGRIELTGAALESLTIRSAESVAGVRVRRPRRRVKLTVDGKAVHVELVVDAGLGAVLPVLGEAVQRSVAASVGASTGLPATVDVLFEELA
jgi:uncharacterized alkaline shock family protein YloU